MNAMTPGGLRESLKDALPLRTPYMIQMFPCYTCNFRCGFCLYALEKKQHGFISNQIFMDMSLYRKCIDDMKSFPEKLKMLRFAAIGEPLLHERIADMVAYAKQADIAESVDIVTNGEMLTEALSDRLIAAGLDRLRISVEGLSAEDYYKNAGKYIDFERFVDQIKYFYEHSTHTHIYIKIIDYMVQKPEDQERFFDIFRPICHSINIEHLSPTIAEIDFNQLAGGMTMSQTHNGHGLMEAELCPQGFYMMQINPDGKVVPCCSVKYPAILGDVGKESVPEIWNGTAFNSFRSNMLRGHKKAGAVCSDCNLFLYELHPEDILDDYAEKLLAYYQ